MKKNSYERDSNYELLRILAGMAIVVLHFNYHPNGGGALVVATGANYYFLLVLEVACACAVNVFILISGYFGCNSSTIKFGKLAELLLQTICFSLAFYLIYCIKQGDISLRSTIASMIPANYFVILYIALMCVAPFINKLLALLTTRQFKVLVIVLLVVFSGYPTLVDVFKEITGNEWNGLSTIGLEGSMRGYSIVNFVLLYILGAWIRKDGTLSECKVRTLLVSLLGIIAIVVAWRSILPQTAWMYCNPLIIVEAMIVFVLFGKIQVTSRTINRFASAAFTCFLVQSKLLEPIVGIAEEVESFPIMVLLLFGSIVSIYIVAYAAKELWKWLTKIPFRYTTERIPSISID